MVLPQKVLSIEDGKIPTKKVKVDLSNSKMWSLHSDFHFFGREFVILNTYNFSGRDHSKKNTL